MPNEIPVFFSQWIKLRLSFIRKGLANEFKGQFECLEENTEKYKTFSFPIEKEIRKVDQDGRKDIMTISYKIKFTNSAKVYGKFIIKSCR